MSTISQGPYYDTNSAAIGTVFYNKECGKWKKVSSSRIVKTELGSPLDHNGRDKSRLPVGDIDKIIPINGWKILPPRLKVRDLL